MQLLRTYLRVITMKTYVYVKLVKLMNIRNDLTYKIRDDLCISDGDREILTIELLTKSMKNIIVSCCYKPPDGNWKNHCDHLQKILTNATKENKLYFVTGHFNLNCLEFHHSSEIRQFFNDMFKKRAIPLINRPTRVTMTTFLRTAFLIHLSKTE